ncbi:MAG: outer membrane beta-barrel protein [Nonlabens sp.]
MKKILLTAVIALCGLGLANAQEGSIYAGLNVGLPIGDFGDSHTFGIGVEAGYLYPVSESLMVGGNVGFMSFSGDEVDLGPLGSVEIDAINYVPIAATAIYSFGDSGFGVGADVGYALALDDVADGGLMYEPKAVFNTETLMFSLGYQTVADVVDLSSIQLGAAYKF